jgi:ABC-2 type transport system ATP-binding protein
MLFAHPLVSGCIEGGQVADLAIETNGLSKTYGHVPALTDVDIRVPYGALAGLLGPAGAGKSTAIRLLLGLHRPTAGGGRVLGLDMVKQSRQLRQRAGYLAQPPRYDDWMTVRQVVRFAVRLSSIPARQREDRIQQALDLVGLRGLQERRVERLSTAERTRLAIAQAAVTEPEVLFLDEPTAGLDGDGRSEVLDIIARFRGRATVLIATHTIGGVERRCDHLLILHGGRLVSQGPIEQVLRGHGVATFTLRLIGVTEGLAERVRRAYWVAGMTSTAEAGIVRWRVNVTDVELARAWLPRLILSDNNVQLIEYGPEKQDLGDVFAELVRKGDHAGN